MILFSVVVFLLMFLQNRRTQLSRKRVQYNIREIYVSVLVVLGHC